MYSYMGICQGLFSVIPPVPGEHCVFVLEKHRFPFFIAVPIYFLVSAHDQSGCISKAKVEARKRQRGQGDRQISSLYFHHMREQMKRAHEM